MKNRFRILLFSYPLFFFLFASCGSLKDPEFKTIENVRISKIGVVESQLLLDIIYSNPNNSRLKLKKAEGEAWVENTYLGHFKIDSLIHIPRSGEFRLPITLMVDMKKFLKNSILSILSNEVTIKVKGNAKVGKGFLYINYPIQYEGKQNLRELAKEFF